MGVSVLESMKPDLHVSLPAKLAKKPLDRLFESLRFAKVQPHIPKGARLLDIGAGDGSFLQTLGGHIQWGVGIDPLLPTAYQTPSYRLICGDFPCDFSVSGHFDVITLLAVIEHLPRAVLQEVVAACWQILSPGGQVIITVPHPCVDRILAVLKFLRIIHGLALEEHHGFDPEELPEFFDGWRLVKKERWELGCNYLFIFAKP